MTVGKSALSAVSVGIYTALNVSSYTGAAGVSPGGLFDYVPQRTATYPYTTFSVSEQDGGGATFGAGGKELTVRVRVWDSATAFEGLSRAQAAMSEAARLLHHTLPAATGFTSLLMTYYGSFPIPMQRVNDETMVAGVEGTFTLLVEQA